MHGTLLLTSKRETMDLVLSICPGLPGIGSPQEIYMDGSLGGGGLLSFILRVRDIFLTLMIFSQSAIIIIIIP